jgi:hypothetical protein
MSYWASVSQKQVDEYLRLHNVPLPEDVTYSTWRVYTEAVMRDKREIAFLEGQSMCAPERWGDA